jgi:hypothetical protein
MGGGWAWVRLGKIKCAAKALARVAACSSFNFAKGWHFVCHFSVRLLSVVSVFRVSANGLGLCDGGGFEFPLPTTAAGFCVVVDVYLLLLGFIRRARTEVE